MIASASASRIVQATIRVRAPTPWASIAKRGALTTYASTRHPPEASKRVASRRPASERILILICGLPALMPAAGAPALMPSDTSGSGRIALTRPAIVDSISLKRSRTAPRLDRRCDRR